MDKHGCIDILREETQVTITLQIAQNRPAVCNDEDHTWRWWLPRYGLCNGSSAVQVVSPPHPLSGPDLHKATNMQSIDMSLEGFQLEQLRSHYIARTAVATVTKYDQIRCAKNSASEFLPPTSEGWAQVIVSVCASDRTW